MKNLSYLHKYVEKQKSNKLLSERGKSVIVSGK